MTVAFYLAGGVAVVATLMVLTRAHAVHALLYLVVSFFAVALVFLLVGAPFIAALEVIIYAGAIMVLFIFVVMMLEIGPRSLAREREWLRARVWIGPGLLSLVLLAELVWVLGATTGPLVARPVSPREVGAALWGPYVLATELAGLLLLAGLVAAYHVARRAPGRRAS